MQKAWAQTRPEIAMASVAFDRDAACAPSSAAVGMKLAARTDGGTVHEQVDGRGESDLAWKRSEGIELRAPAPPKVRHR